MTKVVMVQGAPKKLIYFSAFLTALTLAVLQYAVWKSYKQYRHLHEIEFPLLERNSIAIRLREKNSHIINRILYLHKINDLNEYELMKQAQTNNLNDMQKMSLKTDFRIDDTLFETRQNFLNIEKNIIEKIKAGSYTDAKKTYESQEYNQSLEDYQNNLQKITEQLGIQRDDKMQKQVQYLRIFALGTMLSILFMIICWVHTLRFIKKMNLQRKASERKLQYERGLRIASEKLASLGEMAGGVAHEINNPLAILSAQLQLLQTQQSQKILTDEKLKNAITRMNDVCARISRITNGLLAFSRNDPTQKYEKQKLSKILEDTLSLCTEKIKHQGIALSITGNQDLELECHIVEIEQILLNLLNNAIAALAKQPNPSIVINCIDGAEFIELQVTDNGPGISKENREKIWQPFFTTKEVGKGTGLGLSISKSFAESHGGTLTLVKDSLVTCFSLKLPKYKNNNQNAA